MTGLIDSIADNFESLVEWFFKLLNIQDKETIGKISAVIWAIWRQRNDQYWNGSHESAERMIYLVHESTEIMVYFVLECLFNWISIQESTKADSQARPCSVQQCWKRPPPGFVKCNIDATVFHEEGKSSWGIVVRDSQGLFMHGASRLVDGLFLVRELEAMGLREALSWIKNLGLYQVIFESDSLHVV